jgi:hypothetical protein
MRAKAAPKFFIPLILFLAALRVSYLRRKFNRPEESIMLNQALADSDYETFSILMRREYHE